MTPVMAGTEPTYHCPSCLDERSGWRLFWCPGVGDGRVHDFGVPEAHVGRTRQVCGRFRAHDSHPYAERCTCVETNPVIQAHRQRSREAAEKYAARDKAKR